MPTTIKHLIAATPAGAVNESGGTIRGVSLISTGEARGHFDTEGRQIVIDDKTLSQISACAARMGTLKMRLNHGSGVQDTAGYIDNIRREGGKVLGDLNFYHAEENKAKLLEIAQRNPDHLGLSLEFDGVDEISGDGKSLLARCDNLYAVALVSDPAANKQLFSVDTSKNKPCVTAQPQPNHPPMSTPAAVPAVKALADPVAGQTPIPDNAAMFKQCMDAIGDITKRLSAIEGAGAGGDGVNPPGPGTKPPTVSPAIQPAVQVPNAARQENLSAAEAQTKLIAETVEATVKKLAAVLGVPASAPGVATGEVPGGDKSTKKDFNALLAAKTTELKGDAHAAMQFCLANHREEYVAYKKSLCAPRGGKQMA